MQSAGRLQGITSSQMRSEIGMRLLFLLFAVVLAFSEAAKLEAEHEHADTMHPRKIVKGKGPIIEGPITGGSKDVTGSNDRHLAEVSEFADTYLKTENSSLHFVQIKAEVQVVAGLMYTLLYVGNNDHGMCQEEHTLVVYDKPWAHERTLKSDTVSACT